MMKYILWAVVTCFMFGGNLEAQDLYYRHLNKENISAFDDTINKIFFKGDTSVQFRHHFKYVLRFFSKMQYDKIEVNFKPSKKIAQLKPSFGSMFQSPDKRKYKVWFSTSAVSALDSVTLKNLGINAQVGLIARQVSHIEDLSTSGFFDILFWHFKQLSKRAKNKQEKDAELKVLEAGLGYQLLALSKSNQEKLKIEKWNDARSYAFYFKHYRKRYMDSETISNFLNDLPVYASHNYK